MHTLRRAVVDHYEGFGKRGAAVIATLEKAGVSVPAGSRFRRYIAEVERVIERGTWRRDLDTDLFHQATLEFEDLEFIIGSLDDAAIQRFKGHLKELVSGHVSPRADRNSRSRDLQFELVLAATLQSNGIAVRLDEPDLTFEVDGVAFAVAAKRVKSRAKLGANLREAEKQLAAAGFDGVIALDLSIILNPENRFLRAANFGAAGEVVRRSLVDFVRINARRILADTRPTASLGILAYFALMVEDLSVPRLGTIRHTILSPFNLRCGSVLQRFFPLFSRSTAMSRSTNVTSAG